MYSGCLGGDFGFNTNSGVASLRLTSLLPRPKTSVPAGQISPSEYMTLRAFRCIVQTLSPGLHVAQVLLLI